MTTVTTNVIRRRPLRAYGLNGVALTEGQVITGTSNLQAITVEAANYKWTYEAKTPDADQRGAHTLYCRDSTGVWRRTSSIEFGDWTYFARSFDTFADRATVVELNSDAVEIAFQWDAYSLTSYPGGGILHKDDATNNVIYPANSSTGRRITATKLIKSVRMHADSPGYFAGYHTSPRVGPPAHLIHLTRNESDWGEREFGTGGGAAVVFSSGGAVSRHPAWGADARWAAAEAAVGSTIVNRTAWMRVCDNSAGTWAVPAVVTLQNEAAPGFPGLQSNGGPYWMASIPADYTTYPFCQIIGMRDLFECGAWQFGNGEYGIPVCHFTNEVASPTGQVHRHQVFQSAIPYRPDASSSFANEPSSGIQETVATIMENLEWPSF